MFGPIDRKPLEDCCDKIVESVFDKYFNANNEMGFYLLLLGKGIFKIEAFPDAGHNFHLILESIYKYAKNNSVAKTQHAFEVGLFLCAKKLCIFEDCCTLLNFISTEVRNEDEGTSPFKIDVVPILKDLRNNVAFSENMSSSWLALEEIDRSCQYLQNNYNVKFS